MSPETLTRTKRLIPHFKDKPHKGQSGRIGVIGGALDTTGATFFSAISSLYMGADISRVICSPGSASTIKNHSSDLVVHPIFVKGRTPSSIRSELSSIFMRLDAIIIGPGLGREENMQQFAKFAFILAKEQGMYIVLDGAALWMVQNDPTIMTEYHKVILTPNKVESERLSDCLGISPGSDPHQVLATMSRRLGGATILQKGPTDFIGSCHADQSTNEESEGIIFNEIDTQGSLKRSGGQGHVLAGVTATILAWAKDYELKDSEIQGEDPIPPTTLPFLAAVGGSVVTRTAAKMAFTRNGREMVTQDIIRCIGDAFEEVFGQEMGRGA